MHQARLGPTDWKKGPGGLGRHQEQCVLASKKPAVSWAALRRALPASQVK